MLAIVMLVRACQVAREPTDVQVIHGGAHESGAESGTD